MRFEIWGTIVMLFGLRNSLLSGRNPRLRTTLRLFSDAPTLKLFYNDVFEVKLPQGHRFPMEKYRKVRTILQSEFASDNRVIFEQSPLSNAQELATTHCREYISRFLTGEGMTAAEIRAVGFPWSLEGTKRALSSVGGTIAAMREVCSGANGASGHIAGGTHHAFHDYGEGFCVFSDIAVAANLALRDYEHISKILILDCDVHQGNGNAKLFESNPAVFTFSMHCSGNYFSQKQVSDIDVELAVGTRDAEYLEKLKGWLPFLFEVVKPNLVFFQAGVDVFHGDRLGKLSLTRAAVQRRNELVCSFARRFKTPLVLTMGGGYPKSDDASSENYQDVIQCHADCYRQLYHSFIAEQE